MSKAGLTAAEAATYLGVSRNHFFRHLRKHLKAANLARPGSSRPLYRYHKDELDRFLKDRSEGG